MLTLILYGSHGRMGGAVERVALEAGDVRIKARVDRGVVPAGAAAPDPVLPEPARPGDVVVDFSSPEGLLAACRMCDATGAALVSGTTGIGPEGHAALEALARKVPVLHAANFSLGVLALRRAVAAALAAVPGSWDVEIVERHHRRKADAPSGTALALARDVAAQRGMSEAAFRNGREGRVGERPAKEIGIHAVRGGSWTGDHVVLLAGDGEWLELRHVAQDRSAFAQGALAAARFVSRAAAGSYRLEEVAGIQA